MSDKEKIICHRCRWGATPGNLHRCHRPGLSPLMEFGNVSLAVAEGHCGHYEPDTSTALTEITNKLEEVGNDLHATGELYRAEMEERERKGITTPTEEIKHFNEWMAAHNRPDLMIKPKPDTSTT